MLVLHKCFANNLPFLIRDQILSFELDLFFDVLVHNITSKFFSALCQRQLDDADNYSFSFLLRHIFRIYAEIDKDILHGEDRHYPHTFCRLHLSVL